MVETADRAADAARALHNSTIRGFTHGRILRGIAQQVGGGARRELAEALDISTATVTRAVSMMSTRGLGLIEEGRHQPSGPGRPVAPLILSRSLAMIGIAVTPERGKPAAMFGTVCHLDGSPIDPSKTIEPRPLGVAARKNKNDFLHEIGAYALDLKKMSNLEDGDILGCGVTIAGYVGSDGDIRGAYGGSWSSVDQPFVIRKTLEEHLGIPVIVGNDTTSLAIRKNLRPSQPSDNYTLLIALDYGVGGALVINNKTWLGAHGMASEPGHLPATGAARVTYLSDEDPKSASAITPMMPSCQCETDAADLDEHGSSPQLAELRERSGHVEAFASPHAIERRAFENGYTAQYRPVGELAARPRSDREISMLFYQGGLALGRAVLSGINWIDPERVVIYLPADQLHVPNQYLAGSYYLRGLDDEIARNSFTGNMESVVSVRGLSLENMYGRLASGAAYLVLRRLIRLVNGEEQLPGR